MQQLANENVDADAIERAVRKSAGRQVSNATRRRPMIVPVVIEN